MINSTPSLLSIPGRRIAAPSWVMPGSLAENCRFLSKKVDEVGLLFFETKSCLAYTEHDLPSSLAELTLTFHVHLPFDLPWESGEKSGRIAAKLMDKVDFLHAKKAVLHPSAHTNNPVFLKNFLHVWKEQGRKAEHIFLENIDEEDLISLQDTILHLGLRVCLDIGHLLAYRQENLGTCPSLLERTGIVHLNAPGKGKNKTRHEALDTLSLSQIDLVQRICSLLPQEALVMLELFSWDQIIASMPIARQWLSTPPATGA